MNLLREQDLLAPVSQYAQRKGYRLQKTEMPFYSYRIDLYGYSRQTKSTIAIELKLTNWKRALEQALVYQLCSDFVFIALPRPSTLRVPVDHLVGQGIGLIGVGPNGCRTLIAAKQSAEVRRYYREPFIGILQGELSGR